MDNKTKWDKYFLDICISVSLNSKCHSRQIGAILVKDNIVISTGYNGPAREIPECRERFLHDDNMKEILCDMRYEKISIENAYKNKTCPRKFLKFKSGEGLEYCNAVHAEKNCLISAARMGISTKGATLYMNAEISPCTQCFSACINAGIKEIVLIKNKIYDPTLEWCIKNSNIVIREFNI